MTLFHGREGALRFTRPDGVQWSLRRIRKWRVRTDAEFMESNTDFSYGGGVQTPAKVVSLLKTEWTGELEGYFEKPGDVMANPMVDMMKLAGMAIVYHEGQNVTRYIYSSQDFNNINKLNGTTWENTVLAHFVLEPGLKWLEGKIWLQNFEVEDESEKSVLFSATLKGTGALEYHLVV